MKRYLLLLTLAGFCASCASLGKSKKRGCASTSANMGAERVLAGEKPEKKQKYKVKGMN